MIIPSPDQITQIVDVISTAIQQLIQNDSDIFDYHEIIPTQISEDAKQLNRELHETSINHRLAFYIENILQNTNLAAYNVDIEYNRYYGNPKLLETLHGQLQVRPDIIVHSRMNREITPQHYLVIEAKKGSISRNDFTKIDGFISDDNYNYLFGLTISYCTNDDNVIANLHYYNGTEITRNTTLSIQKLRRANQPEL